MPIVPQPAVLQDFSVTVTLEGEEFVRCSDSGRHLPVKMLVQRALSHARVPAVLQLYLSSLEMRMAVSSEQALVAIF